MMRFVIAIGLGLGGGLAGASEASDFDVMVSLEGPFEYDDGIGTIGFIEEKANDGMVSFITCDQNKFVVERDRLRPTEAMCRNPPGRSPGLLLWKIEESNGEGIRLVSEDTGREVEIMAAEEAALGIDQSRLQPAYMAISYTEGGQNVLGIVQPSGVSEDQ